MHNPGLRPSPASRQAGLALGVILLAVALLAALGIAMVSAGRLNVRAGRAGGEQLLATILLQQGATLKMALVQTQVKSGFELTNLLLDTSSTATQVGVYHPLNGATEPQLPPPQAAAPAVTLTWRWPTAATVTLPGVGSEAGRDHVLWLRGVSGEVCAQINKLLANSATIPAVNTTFPDPLAATTYNFTSTGTYYNAALLGRQELCIRDNAGVHFYYKVVGDS